jgi:hypothetical protein
MFPSSANSLENACCCLPDNDRTFPAANFEFVAVGVFEKEGVITWTVALANFRPFELFPARVTHEFRNPIYLFPRIGPKSDACAIRFVIFIWTKAKEFRRSVAPGGKKSMEISPGFFVNKSKLWQKFPVKLFRRFHVSHPQIDVIKATRFHVSIFNRMARHFKHCDRKKVGRAVLCAPFAIKNIGAHLFGFAQGKLVARPTVDASQTITDIDLFCDEARQNRSKLFHRGLWPQLPVCNQCRVQRKVLRPVRLGRYLRDHVHNHSPGGLCICH